MIEVGLAQRCKKWDTPSDENFERINVCKGKGEIGNELSPFFIQISSKYIPDFIKNKKKTYALELVYQSAKMMVDETRKDYETRVEKIYKDGTVKRSYYSVKKFGVQCAIFKTGKNTVDEFDYLHSRYFYCKLYTLSCILTESFWKLFFIAKTNGLMIVGPDGYSIKYDKNDGIFLNNLYVAYKDLSVPFGHERVLFCLIGCIMNDISPDNYPWETIETEHNPGLIKQKYGILYNPKNIIFDTFEKYREDIKGFVSEILYHV